MIEAAAIVLPVEIELLALLEPGRGERAHGGRAGGTRGHLLPDALLDVLEGRLRELLLADVVAGGRVLPLAVDVLERDPELVAALEDAHRSAFLASQDASAAVADPRGDRDPFGAGRRLVRFTFFSGDPQGDKPSSFRASRLATYLRGLLLFGLRHLLRFYIV